MKATLGDVIQIDGGLVIVVAIKGDRATVAPVSDFGGKKPHALVHGMNTEITRNRLFESRGEDGLAEFLELRKGETKQKRKGKIKLEPGDQLCYQGELCTVVSVAEHSAVIGDLAGDEWAEERWLNEYFFQDCACHKLVRLDVDQRADNLRHFLAQRKSPPPRPETSDETETPHTETMRASEPKKPSRKRVAKPATKKAEHSGPFTGRAAFTRNLAATTKKSVEQIHAESKAVFPGASLSTTRKLVESERAPK